MEGVLQAELADKAGEIARVHEEGLDVALLPAGALADPVRQRTARLLPRRRVEHARLVSRAGEADAEVAVLGDVVGVPSHQIAQNGRAEVVRRAAERYDRAEVGEAGKREVEPARIVRREVARQEVVARVVVVEPRLDAGHALRRGGEGEDGLLELVGFRAVLGVVDDEEFALRLVEADVAGLRLCAREGRRNGSYPHEGRQADCLCRFEGDVVVGFEKKLDVELVLRVVELGERRNHLRERLRLVVHRHENRVHRPVARGRHLLL